MIDAVADLISDDANALLVQLPRTTGRKEAELMHPVCGAVDLAAYADKAAANRSDGGSAQSGIAALEARVRVRVRVRELEAEKAQLRHRLGEPN